LGSKIDQLAKNLEMQLLQRKLVNEKGVGDDGDDDDEDDDRFVRHSKELLKSATKVLSRQNTLILEDCEMIDIAIEVENECEEHDSEFEEIENQDLVPPSDHFLQQKNTPLRLAHHLRGNR
jgi:hypothetical protein